FRPGGAGPVGPDGAVDSAGQDHRPKRIPEGSLERFDKAGDRPDPRPIPGAATPGLVEAAAGAGPARGSSGGHGGTAGSELFCPLVSPPNRPVAFCLEPRDDGG